MSKVKFIQNQIVKLKPKSQLTRNPKDWYDPYLDTLIKDKPELRISGFYREEEGIVEVKFTKRNEILGWDTKLHIDNLKPIKLPIIRKEYTDRVDEILKTYSHVHFEDRGTGGYSLRNIKLTEDNLRTCILNTNQIGISIPQSPFDPRLLQIHEVDPIISTGIYKYDFQATEYTHINRTFTFIKHGDPLPKEDSCSW